jgi:hypothetical protein
MSNTGDESGQILNLKSGVNNPEKKKFTQPDILFLFDIS